MKKNSFSKLFCATVMTFSLFCVNTHAINAQESQDNDFYIEEGQINLENLSLEYVEENDEIVVNSKSRTTNTAIEEDRLLTILETSPELNKYLKRSLSEGNSSENMYIGYSTVYLKEIEVQGGTDVYPLSKTEMQNINSRIVGNGTTYHGGKFTLYTVAQQNPATGQYAAGTVGQWYDLAPGLDNKVRLFYTPDAISLYMPEGFMCTDSRVNGDYRYSDKVFDGDRNTIYSVQLVKEGDLLLVDRTIALDTKGLNYGFNMTEKKATSCYVHNYSQLNLSFSGSPTSPSIGVGGNSNYWTISSSVIFLG